MTTDALAAPPPGGVTARYFNAYRLAAYALVLYTFGHTSGAVIATPEFGPGSDAVVAVMKSVHVIAQGADCTWYGFYRGFGIFVSIFMAFSVVIAWHLGGKSARERAALAPLTWGLFASYAVTIVTSWAYFFPAPLVFSTLVTVLLGVGCVGDMRAARGSTADRGA
jgi:hypothetical protein